MIPGLSRAIYPAQEAVLHRPTFAYWRELERSQWRDLPDRHIPGGTCEPPKVPPKRARRG